MNEGSTKAKTAGTKARSNVKATLPNNLRKVTYLLAGIAAILWLFITLGDAVSNFTKNGTTDSTTGAAPTDTTAEAAPSTGLDWSQTKLGSYLDSTLGEGTSWLLWIPVIMLVIYLIRKVFFKSKSSPGNTDVIGTIFGLVILGTGVLVIVFVLAVILDWSGTLDRVANIVQNKGPSVNCTTQKELTNAQFDNVGRDITICPTEGALYLYGSYGKQLVINISPQFMTEHAHLLPKSPSEEISSFVTLLPPKSFAGSSANSWKIIPVTSNPNQRIVSGFEKRGLPYIVLTVKAL